MYVCLVNNQVLNKIKKLQLEFCHESRVYKWYDTSKINVWLMYDLWRN